MPACALHQPSMVIRTVILLAMMAVPMPLGAAPPDGADPNSPLGIWYRSLRVPDTGQSCCSVSDCRPVDSAWIEGDHWRACVGEPEEIAAAVVWLCSPAASFMVGHAMAVDGGILAG
jgi:hypothetical protein